MYVCNHMYLLRDAYIQLVLQTRSYNSHNILNSLLIKSDTYSKSYQIIRITIRYTCTKRMRIR